MNFNREQLDAIYAGKGAWCVLAGPGAGKTACLVARYQRLSEFEGSDRGILCLTFTRAAAEEMRVRATGSSAHPWPPPKRPYGFRTFHAMAYWIVKQKDSSLADVDQPDFDDLLRRAIKILDEDAGLRAKLQYDWIMVDEANDLTADQVRLVQRLARYKENVFVVGDPNQCQPPGTMVTVVTQPARGRHAAILVEKPIEALNPNTDLLQSWTKGRGAERTYTTGRTFQKAYRPYNGYLLTVATQSGLSTRVTPDHQMWVRFARGVKQGYMVYLMWRPDLGFRVGISTLKRGAKNQFSFGLTARINQEHAEKTWILKLVATRYEALMWERIYSIKYQLPDIVFEAPPTGPTHTKDLIAEVFKVARPENGFQCLEDHGLLFGRPLVDRQSDSYRKWRGYFKTAAANILPGLMDIPLPGINKSSLVSSLHRERYCGPVYSLNVDPHHTYIADGVVVGNCIYGFAQSDPDFIVDFPRYFPGGRYLTIGENYRSTQEIVRFCKAIAPVRGQLLERLRTGNEVGSPPTMSRHTTNVDEALAIIDLISKQPAELDPRGTTAILARTNQQLNLFDRLGCPSYVERVTIHKSKGLQWRHVYLIGCQEGLMPLAGADVREEARIMFVGCSRAVKSLHISFAGTPSRFIRNFLPAEMKQ